MSYKFRLSNRQRKELLVRRAAITIAVPLPLDWPDNASAADIRRHILAYVPDDATEDNLVEVAEDWVAVNPTRGGNGTSAVIGSLLETADQRHLHLTVLVAIGVLSLDRSRHTHPKPQWPGEVIAFAD